jgi:hypothetical protein
VTGAVVAPMNVFCRRPGRVSIATSSSETGRTHKSRDPVEVNLTPPTSAVSHFYVGTSRHLADYAESRAGPCTQNGLVSRRHRSCVSKPGCDDKKTGAERAASPPRHLFLSLIFAPPRRFFAPTQPRAGWLQVHPRRLSEGSPRASSTILFIDWMFYVSGQATAVHA